ncbi:MAG TPA: ABC transporter substrate-binding protein [Burkholderiales bacterium]|nr:ABC transporter substrate-binding protein [Burkholderiales bacterium]
MKRIAIAAVFAASLLASAAGAQVETPEVKITLDWAFQGPQSIFLYGLDEGRFKAEGLRPTIDRGSGSSDVMTRVASRAYQFGWADIATMIKFNAENPGSKLMAVYVTGGNSPLAVVTVDGRGIKTPKDLEGKTLGATAGSAAFTMFNEFAKAAGFDPSKITWRQLSGQLREPMMVKGNVDAVAGFTTSSIMSVVQLGVPLEKVVTLRYNDYGLKQYGTAIIVRPDFAKQNPKTVAAVVRAINHSLIDAIANPQKSVQAIKPRDALVDLKTECIRLVEGLETLTLTPEFKKNGISSVDPKRMGEAIDETVKAFELKTKPALEEVYTPAFLPPAAERMPPRLGACA